jgi:NADPH:quinone reductase
VGCGILRVELFRRELFWQADEMLAVTVQSMGVAPDYALNVTAESVAEPIPGPDEELIDLVAADVVPLDRQIAAGLFPPARTVPLQAGVSAVGVRRSDGAMVSVQGGHVGMGWNRPGCFATSFVAPSNVCVPLPTGLDPMVAAAGGETAITAHLVLHDHAAVKVGETVLVLGANGGVGRACVQLAVHLGCTVIAAARNPEALVVPEGVRTVSYDQLIGLGADVIVDPVGGSLFQTAILAGGHRCRHVFLGYPAGAVIELKLPLLMIAEHRIMGFNEHACGHDRFMAVTKSALHDLTAGVFDPKIGQSFPLQDAALAYAAIGTGVGRVLLTP